MPEEKSEDLRLKQEVNVVHWIANLFSSFLPLEMMSVKEKNQAHEDVQRLLNAEKGTEVEKLALDDFYGMVKARCDVEGVTMPTEDDIKSPENRAPNLDLLEIVMKVAEEDPRLRGPVYKMLQGIDFKSIQERIKEKRDGTGLGPEDTKIDAPELEEIQKILEEKSKDQAKQAATQDDDKARSFAADAAMALMVANSAAGEVTKAATGFLLGVAKMLNELPDGKQGTDFILLVNAAIFLNWIFGGTTKALHEAFKAAVETSDMSPKQKKDCDLITKHIGERMGIKAPEKAEVVAKPAVSSGPDVSSGTAATPDPYGVGR